MIIINETGTSSVIFKLNKISKYVTPYYVFEAINPNSKEKTTFTSVDVSPSPLSYNEFIFENGVTFSATQSKFDLNTGVYLFNIYETEFSTATLSASGSLLYQGELRIDGDIKPDTSYYIASNNDTVKYFE